ncbi:hypothetical protein EXIGLDRAFT_720105 [Exidia glandulosa HHB12029]|uniref:Uncharacterized protein n=1 Tax=Exidia glandulosa HHB12029 TaxID=1314781 RepID=A0A165GMD9_EXIGL|nr:hypothetical protein EXIGLDRAFT_720105 [Exidia glandulosa HHB12029]
MHSSRALSNLAFRLGDPNSWNQTDRLDTIWFKTWQHLAYSLRLRHESAYGPHNLIASAFWDPTDRHAYSDDLPDRHLFASPAKREDIVSVILCTAGNADQPIPSIWQLAMENEYNYPLVVATRELAAALCTMTRNGGNTDDFITAFLTPPSFARLAGQLHFMDSRNDSYRSVCLAICSHLMELRPSWWVEGMDHLMNEDGQALMQSLYGEMVAVSSLPDFVVEMTNECLRSGPCYDCPLVVTPLAFDISLRTYTVNPFAVYPIVDVDDDA